MIKEIKNDSIDLLISLLLSHLQFVWLNDLLFPKTEQGRFSNQFPCVALINDYLVFISARVNLMFSSSHPR